ncbi:hypothetical protein [Methylomicrobium sp. Wu6]|uniref:hypothetical protein n=1 Tax=Methylomicrobium sp. Wu6 TaxID=3107928 RepID=UPI002DD65D1E|nr:hypothetical protein [Methylomicrobium sp. Wu6]MEC4747619.1 hypothetical protein [Methylomicrobium sp. Wu6]
MNKLNEVFIKIQQLSSRQRRVCFSSSLVGSLILLPDLYLAGAHYLLEFLHIFYESLCFMFEELIGHSLHLSKYHSQLILFYVQVAIIGGVAYKVWRTAPGLYRRAKAYVRASYQQLLTDGKQYWAEMPSRKRLKVLAGCAAGMFGIYFWVTS